MSLPDILFEDDSILAFDKPAGMVVNHSETLAKGEKSLEELLEANRETLKIKEQLIRNGIAHRLDKETSG
ncbi:RluA family pseudouridine synthase, partial [candidate division WWE3 bacterium]|nr:RluA family pseudouridine synthase [candidate division WWE3 bacterium]